MRIPIFTKILGIAAFVAILGVVGWQNFPGKGHANATRIEEDLSTEKQQNASEDQQAFETLLSSRNPSAILEAGDYVRQNWQPAFVPLSLEVANFSKSLLSRETSFSILREKTGEDFGKDVSDWYFWFWNQPEARVPFYADFKADLYRTIDRKFETYFKGRQDSTKIRFDEIRWGGVLQDGIPPLRNPEMISPRKATYLEDDNIIFGVEVNGDARAYPKRILAWHEMFVDKVGGIDVAGVYCTLCGTVVLYKTEHKGVKHRLGTSGFLYRSNKLMYDQKTQSLWNTLAGEPVVGPLINQGIALEHLSVVTTTWGEWKRRHPKTKVLSLRTGHRRNYGEGIAYQDYFATDRLMFNTPYNDERLQNKQEVLALRFAGAPKDQLAIDTAFLEKNPIYTDQVGVQEVLVLTDKTGANRVYAPKGKSFASYDRSDLLIDDEGAEWQLTEQALIGPSGQRLERLPYHRAFWFGWRAAFPQTRLVK